jgi:hypothetical protein
MRYTVTWFVCLGLAGCGGSSPVAPAVPEPPAFSTGRYMLELTGYDFSTVPELPVCAGPLGVPSSGKHVSVELQVMRDGAEWVGRSTRSPADIELRFKDAGLIGLGRRAFTGTIRGQGPDDGLPGLVDPRDVFLIIGGSAGNTARVEGETAFSNSVRTLVGRAEGEFRFRDSAGNTGSCSVVSVHINAPPN